MFSNRFLAGVAFITVLFATTSIKGDNPFIPGQYKTAEFIVTPQDDGAPLHSTIYFPLASGNFTPILFIGGMYGYVMSEFYATILNSIASHGYVVVGIDAIYPIPPLEYLEDRPEKKLFWDTEEREMRDLANKRIDSFFKQNTWLRQHINNRTYAIPDWSKTVLSCHSASCDDTLQMIQNDTTLVQASIFLDPMSSHSKKMNPFKSNIKALTYMSELSEKGFPGCCIAGMGYKRIYDLMSCVKVRMEVNDFGHCGVLDHSIWAACHKTHVCKTSDGSRLKEYQSFTTGIMHAFIRWTLYGQTDMKKYVTDQTHMPLNVTNLAYNTTCVV